MHLFGEPEFWIFLAVVAFVIGVWKPAGRAILGRLDARAVGIRDELETARRLREETLARRRRLAEERIAQEEAKALTEIRAVTVDVAISAARQVITSELDQKRGAALIDRAIADLPRQLGNSAGARS